MSEQINNTWIALALLHNEKPDCSSFTFEEVDERVGREFGAPASGLSRWAISLETLVGLGVGIANKPRPKSKNSDDRRYFFVPSNGKIRLFKFRDTAHPTRSEGRRFPEANDIPDKFKYLLDWYRKWLQASL